MEEPNEQALNDPLLYWMPEAMGGGVFAAVAPLPLHPVDPVHLDIPGTGIVTFHDARGLRHVTIPTNMPAWLPGLLTALTRFEQSCDHDPAYDEYCFAAEIAEIPMGYRQYCAAVEEAARRARPQPGR